MATDTPHSTPQQWLDWGDHTVTLDPTRNHAWIHEGADDRHHSTIERGINCDAFGVSLVSAILADTKPVEAELYMPTASMVNAQERWQAAFGHEDRHHPRAEGERDTGTMPVIRAMLDAGRLPESSKQDIERDCYQSRHHVMERIFDRGAGRS